MVAAAGLGLAACSGARHAALPPTTSTVTSAPATTTTSTVARPPARAASGFAPLSASFVSPEDAFVLGQAPCPAGECTVLEATTDAGWSWQQRGRPPLPLVDLSAVRFANADVGYAYGPDHLELTTDGGRGWSAISYPGEATGSRLDQLAINNSEVVVITTAPGPGPVVTASRSPIGPPDWLTIPGTAVAAPTAGDTPQLAMGYGSGYLLSGPLVVGGPVASGWTRHPAPCPTGLDVAERISISGPDGLYLACSGQGAGGQYQKALFVSEDAGSSFSPDGPGPPSAGQLQFISSTENGPFVTSTFADTQVSAPASAGWTNVFHAGDGQPVTDFGFTNDAQGLLVLGNPAGMTGPGDGLYLTSNGGATWTPVDFSLSSLPPTCNPAQLQIHQGTTGAAAGSTAVAFELHTSGQPCSLYGYPGVSFESTTGQTLAVATRASQSMLVQARPELPVVLTASTPATFFISGSDNPVNGATTCPTSASMVVYPPGATQSISVPVAFSLCTGATVSIVVPGVQNFFLGP